jgi:hypothetical protein
MSKQLVLNVLGRAAYFALGAVTMFLVLANYS